MADIEVITLSQAVETIKTAILQSQARAARNVSANQLALYFSVGGYISLNTRPPQGTRNQTPRLPAWDRMAKVIFNELKH